jgi:transposase
MGYELTEFEWTSIRPFLPKKSRGLPRVSDRRVLNGIFWILRSGAPWRDLPESFVSYTTCYNRFVRWRAAGIRDFIMEAARAIQVRAKANRLFSIALTFNRQNRTTRIFAVGTRVTSRPPHRSVRAQFGHTAPTLDV